MVGVVSRRRVLRRDMAKSEGELKKEKKQTDAIGQAMLRIQKKFGAGAIHRGDAPFVVEMFTAGSLSFDEALGGGLPRGRVVEYHGPEHSFKTAASLIAIAKAQARGEVCAFFDAEQALDPSWAIDVLGVQWKKLIYSDENMAERIFVMLEELAASGVSLIVVDSVGNMSAKKELEGEFDKVINMFAPLSKIMTVGLRRLTPIANKHKCTILFINQMRDDLKSFIPKMKTPGGKALKHLASTRVEFRPPASGDFLKTGKDTDIQILGREVRLKVVKNKTGPCFRRGEFRYYYATGVDENYDLFCYCLQKGIITAAGSFLKWDKHRWQGKDAMLEALAEKQELRSSLFQAAQDQVSKDEAEHTAQMEEQRKMLATQGIPEVLGEVLAEEEGFIDGEDGDGEDPGHE